jgi:hypothetical protein
MVKLILLIFSATLLFANSNSLDKCNKCHNNFTAPPYQKVYKHYLLKYSSKERIKNAMIDFLTSPATQKSAMPKGMKRRFNPDEHIVLDLMVIEKAVDILIEREDMIKRLKLAPKSSN